MAEPKRSHRYLGGNGALIIWAGVNRVVADETGVDDWWTNEHVPERLSIPGFVRARRFCARDEYIDETRYLLLYEVVDLEVFSSLPYTEALNNPTPATRQHLSALTTMKRAACKVLSSSVRQELISSRSGSGGACVMIVAHPVDELGVDKLRDSMEHAFKDIEESDKTIMAVSIFLEDKVATEPGTSMQSALNATLESDKGPRGARCIIIFEFSMPHYFINAQAALQPVFTELQSNKACYGDATVQMYDFMCSMSSLGA